MILDIINEDLITTETVSFLSKSGVTVQALRLDKIHPVISGNKWYKLRFQLQEAKLQHKKRIVTFGGAFSNHIVASAAACTSNGFECVGIIRGEEPKIYSHTLKAATAFGMNLVFLSRADYKNKLLPESLINNDSYFIPEGGYSQKGAEGAATIPYNKSQFATICCAVGTGTMIAGLINAKATTAKVLGFSVLKNNFSIKDEVRNLLNNQLEEVNINHDFHFGGYAKYQPDLIKFMNDLYNADGIATDFVYTAKLFYGVNKLIEENYFQNSSNILIIHSGGLQGNLSLRKGTLIF